MKLRMKAAHRLNIQDFAMKNWHKNVTSLKGNQDEVIFSKNAPDDKKVSFHFSLPKIWFPQKITQKSGLYLTHNDDDDQFERVNYLLASAAPLTDKLGSFSRRFRENECAFAIICQTNMDQVSSAYCGHMIRTRLWWL